MSKSPSNTNLCSTISAKYLNWLLLNRGHPFGPKIFDIFRSGPEVNRIWTGSRVVKWARNPIFYLRHCETWNFTNCENCGSQFAFFAKIANFYLNKSAGIRTIRRTRSTLFLVPGISFLVHCYPKWSSFDQFSKKIFNLIIFATFAIATYKIKLCCVRFRPTL